MITSKIFQRSQKHEWVYPEYSSFDAGMFCVRFERLLDEIKPHQTVVRRYILDNQYWEKV